MTWFKVDDSFYDHLKVFDAPDCAVALWVRAGAWAARNLTDGFVPSGMPARLCDDADTAVRELVRRKLWSRVKDGFRFHDWTKYQPTRESVEHDREAATDRKRRERERRKAEKQQVNKGSVTDMSRRDTHVTGGVTHAPVTGPRPGPTRTSKEVPSTAGSAAAEQATFDGMPEPSRPEETPTQQAFRIAREWIEARRAEGVPVTAKSGTDPAIPLKNVIEPAVAAYEEREIRAALRRLDKGIPTRQAFDDVLRDIRKGVNNHNKGRLNGGMQSESNAPKNYSKPERCPKHPSQPKKCGSCRAAALAARPIA